MIYLDLDENGYLRGVMYGPETEKEPAPPHVESLEGLDLDGVRMNAYRWDGEKLTLDGDRLERLLEQERRAEQIGAVKAKLAATDYAVIKIMEGVATREEYAEVIARRQAWRAEVNRLEAETV